LTTLFIDADACPVTREAISVARSHGLAVVLVANDSQNLGKYGGRSGVQTVQVGSGRDSADFAVVERIEPGDFVVTNDTGLAAMVLGRGAKAVSPRGREYTTAAIDMELAVRHAEQKLRRQGGRTRGPAPFEEEDREQFHDSLDRLLRERRRPGLLEGS
jgi:uncharacterized protein YaiI (UPF0178 family)